VRAALNQLLLMQGEERLRAVRDATVSDEIEASVCDFDRHLRDVCGLAEATRWYHRRHVRTFLSWLFADRPVAFAEITPGVLVRFVTERAEGHRPGSIGVLVYSLRTYLRFLAFHGEVSASLTATIPNPPNWSLASLPPSLDPADLERFLAAFDRSSPTGKRDYAMARCLADLGLRCCEVAGMTLDAIDWRAGVLHLPNTKAHREDALPIPEPTGQALADYLCDGRPTTLSRAVFVHHRPPKGHAVQASTVGGAVRRAFARVGLPWTGPHILRHTMATRLFQHGSSLKEIADVLRHRSLDTTQLYTKVDLPRLSQVALPWPGRSS
jgi:site-specific recombinase XerD